MILEAIPLFESDDSSPSSPLLFSFEGKHDDDGDNGDNDNDRQSGAAPLKPKLFVDLLDQHKALLFRRFPSSGDGNGKDNGNDNGIKKEKNASYSAVLSTDDFGRFVVNLQLERYPYVGGAAPRTVVPVEAAEDGIVFTANESPPDQPIPFHHELAQTPNPPRYIFFYCDAPAETGGQTPVLDSTAAYRFAETEHPEFVAKLREHGARYVRTLPAEDDPTSPIGRSYKNAYCVSSRQELDAKLAQVRGCEWTWNDDGSVRVATEPVPAIRLVADPNGNYVFQHTFANSIVAAYLGWQDSRNDRREALQFGNKEKMPEDVLKSIAQFMHEHRVLHPWKKGDVMALNNQRTYVRT